MRRYETVFILRPDLGENLAKETVKRFEMILGGAEGELIETEEWGTRELAYPIKQSRRGFYVRLDYGGTGGTVNELERNLKLSDAVLRHLSVLVDPEADVARLRSEAEARRHRTALAKASSAAPEAPSAPETPPAETAAQAADASAGAGATASEPDKTTPEAASDEPGDE